MSSNVTNGASIDRLRTREQIIDDLRREIEAGQASGEPIVFDLDRIKLSGRKRLKLMSAAINTQS